MEDFMNWKLAGMASTALVTVALTGVSAIAGANKFTGNVSLAVGQSFEDDNLSLGSSTIFDDSFTSITGDAKLNVAFSNNINLQLDFVGTGAFTETSIGFSLDRDSGFQGAAHLYWRNNDQYALGIFAGAGVASTEFLPSGEYYFAGAEGQYYWKNFTFGLAGGYLDSSSDLPSFFPVPFNGDDLFLNDAWFGRAEVRWYATPKFALSADVGYISGEAAFGFADADVLHWGAKAEYWPEEKEPLSLWVAYEGRDTDLDFVPAAGLSDVEKSVHTVKVGLTIHFGVDEGNSQAQDRNGPPWNSTDYGAIVVGG
jgi:hypothetical protein